MSTFVTFIILENIEKLFYVDCRGEEKGQFQIFFLDMRNGFAFLVKNPEQTLQLSQAE